MSTGLFNTSVLTTDLAKKSFAGMITRLMPNGSAPLFGMTSMLQSENAVATEHGFFTKTMLLPQVTTYGSTHTSTDTTINVLSTANILPGMILRINNSASYENIIVNSILSATQMSVTRAVGTVVAATIPASVDMYQVGNAFEEASLRPNSLIINPVRITNFTQIFRNTWAISDTIRQTMMIAGDSNIAESRTDCAAFHAADIEKALFFGQKSQGSRNGQPFRTMDGLVNIVGTAGNYPSYYAGVTNVYTAGGTTTYPQLEGFLDPLFNQTTDPKVGNERVLFVGGTAKKVITNITRLATGSFYQIQDGQTSWGLQYSTLKTSRGAFQMIEHPLFNSNTTWAKMAVGVDLSTFRAAYLGDRKTQNKEFNADQDANDNGIDAVGGTLTTEMTCVVKNPPANGVVYNLTAGAAG
jgi:Family of unknown function (DUF5309)